MNIFKSNQTLSFKQVKLTNNFIYRDEEAFKAYHEGFRNQALKWPINPLDEIVKYIKSRYS